MELGAQKTPITSHDPSVGGCALAGMVHEDRLRPPMDEEEEDDMEEEVIMGAAPSGVIIPPATAPPPPPSPSPTWPTSWL